MKGTETPSIAMEGESACYTLPMADITAIPALITTFTQPIVMPVILLVLCVTNATIGTAVPCMQVTQYLVIPVVEHTNI